MSEADNFVLVTRRGKRRGGRRSSSGKAATPGVTVEQDREVDRELLLRTLDRTVVEIKDTSFTRDSIGKFLRARGSFQRP
ncbi:PREDICTED: uncharacterized protein LOC105566773 isoform X3 [Vollenhovia emeryi]|uniref:uncharacterized protein LOC105566773 isoform X3 n=1 Tax=Vollenhovia emeryi TaxID=411798 RepID=UPI0005F46FF6|nr:PREDICTED: uncharacterized protein LOC105566773 isoform X3 [Vollenhovia emeryi]